jgi:hypothetical protein
MADFAIRYDDFTAGDLGAFDLARPADNGFIRGVNVQPYVSGLLGVRAGFKQLPVEGLPTYSFVPGPVGFDVWDDNLVISMGDELWRVTVEGGTASALPAYPATAMTRTSFARGDGKLYSLVDGELFEHTPSATTLIATPSPLSNFIRWGYYLVGVDANVPWRIWFSTVDASGPHFDQWGANDYIDIANNEPVTALAPVYNMLFVGKPSGWYAVSGVLGVQASVREVQLGNGPLDQRFTSVTTDNRVIYWPLQRVPAWWNGESTFLDERYELAPRELPFLTDGVVVTPTSRRLVLASENDLPETELLTWKSSAWARHRLPFQVTGLTPADVRAGYQLPDDVIYAVRRPVTVGDEPVIATWSHDLNRPAHADDTYASPHDLDADAPVTGSFELPDWFDGQGRMVRVRSVIVQFRKWGSGITGMQNRLQATVTAAGAYERGDEPGRNLNWVEDQSRASVDGTDDSVRMNFGDQGWGNGFRVSFPMLRGVAIREVIVLCDAGKTRT